jgi:hypothetical protein
LLCGPDCLQALAVRADDGVSRDVGGVEARGADYGVAGVCGVV